MNRYPTDDRLFDTEIGTRELYWQDLIMAMKIPGSVFERCLVWVVCHECSRSKRLRATVREMKEGPSGSAIRC